MIACRRAICGGGRLGAIFVAIAVSFFGTAALASFPQLKLITPGGIQRGQSHTLTFHGKRLADTEEVFFYQDGVTAKSIKIVSPKKIEVQVEVDSDCRLGQHVAQLRTRSGISDYRIFHVEASGAVHEVEPNHSPEQAHPIQPVGYASSLPRALGVVVGGTLADEDHDWFAVEGAQGERLSIEVIGMRLGAYCDATLRVIGPDGSVLADVDDTPLTGQDPYASLQLPRDGKYLIHLADAEGRGNMNCRYRLHVGNFPRPKLAVPPVAAREGESEITFLGDPYGAIKRRGVFGLNDGAINQWPVRDQRGEAPSAMPVRPVSGPIFAESEPNRTSKELDKSEQAVLTVPSTGYGALDSDGDVDTFRLRAAKGQRLLIETFGGRIGSPIDTTLRLLKAEGSQLAVNPDAVGLDSQLRFNVPADGDYLLSVSDSLGRFGPMFGYSLSVREIEPSFELGIRTLERYEQRRQSIAVHAGNRFSCNVMVDRDEYDGPIRLVADELPAGIRMLAKTIPADVTEFPVVFEADTLPSSASVESESSEGEKPAESEAGQGALPELYGSLISLKGVGVSEEDAAGTESSGLPVVEGHFVNRTQLMRVQPTNMNFLRFQVDQVAAAILEPAPFSIELVPPAGPVAQNGRMALELNVVRDEGFSQPVTLRVPYRSPGVSTRPSLTVKPNQTSVKYVIHANSKARTGTWPICLTATAPPGGEVSVSTGLQEIEVIERFATVSAPLSSVAVGSNVTIACELTSLNEFAGTATAKLVGLPTGAMSEPVEFSSGDEKIVFSVKVGPKCRVGKHASVSCEVTVMQQQHPIVFRAGSVPLRVTPGEPKTQKVSKFAPGKEAN